MNNLLFPVYGYNLITGSIILYSMQDLENFFNTYMRQNTCENYFYRNIDTIGLDGSGSLMISMANFDGYHTCYYWRFTDREGDLVSLSSYYENYVRAFYRKIESQKRRHRPKKQSLLYKDHHRKTHQSQIIRHHSFVDNIIDDEGLRSSVFKRYSRMKYSIMKETQLRCKRLRMTTDRSWKKHRKNQYHIL